MWRSRKRTPESLLPPCADGTRAHSFVVKDVDPLPDGRVVAVKRTCGRCDYHDTVPKWYSFDGPAPFSTRSSNIQVYGYLRPGQVLASWKPEGEVT